MKNVLIKNLQREDSLDLIQKYVLKNIQVTDFDKNDVASEMFRLFFNVIELGKEIRLSLAYQDNVTAKTKIADIFLVLVSICNSLNINLFDALLEKENELKVSI